MAELRTLPFIKLREMRDAGDHSDAVVAAEHRAFARELVSERPLMAMSLAVAIPFYQTLKAAPGLRSVAAKLHARDINAQPSPSEASLHQAVEAYKGVYEGLRIYKAQNK